MTTFPAFRCPRPFMLRRSAFLAVLLFTIFPHIGGVALGADAVPDEVEKVLADNCLKCHGEKKTSGKLDLRTLDSMLKGGKRGPAVTPSRAGDSRLIQLIQAGSKPHMPPGKKQLSGDEISVLTKWVNGLAAVETETQPEKDEKDGESAAHESAEAPNETVQAWAPPASADPVAVINMLISAGYAQRNVVANELCDDRSFARRIYLDLAGRVPTVEELQSFLKGTDSAKREQLVEQLLASDDFAQHFSSCFDTMLMGRNEKKLRERRVLGWHAYLKTVFQDDRSWEEVAREVLLARFDEDEESKKSDRGRMWFLYERDNKHQEIAESISRGFFGVDIQCAQCHDHPSADEIKQAHYWGLVAFYQRSKNEKSKNGIAIGESAIGGFDSYANALSGSSDKAVLTFLQAETIDEERPEDPSKQEEKDELYVQRENEPRVPRFSRREKFVDDVLDGHPLLERAFVNRTWALLIGRGMVHPIDEMDSQHPASHPELLQWLADDFAKHDFRPKRLIKSIVLSRAYQLESGRPESNPEPSFFAYGLEKPLSAEVMARSLETAFPFDGVKVSGIEAEFRDLFPDVIAKNDQSDLKQTLMLSNLPKLQPILKAAAKQMMERDQPIHDAFQRVFGRAPSKEEQSAIGEYFASHAERPEETMTQVLWALVTSAEFRFNH